MHDTPTPMNAPLNAIEATGLEKIYKAQGKGERKRALKGIDLQIPRGSMFALLGPNGAGKSTFINILAGLVMKTSGTIKIWDTDIDENPRQSRANIGIVPQELNLDAFFTPREMLDVQAGLYGVPKSERRTDELLAAVGLTDKADAYARTLSGGMRRRLMVAKAMVHAPPVLVLDEPTAGVDIELRQSLWAYVRKLNENGTTIVLTTHYLEEAEELCDRIAIINHGEVVACAEKSALLSHLDSKEIHFTFENAVEKIPAELQAYGPEQPAPNQISVRYAPSQIALNSLIKIFENNKLSIKDITTCESDLEDVFLSLTAGAHAQEKEQDAA